MLTSLSTAGSMVKTDCEADCAHDIGTLAAVDMVWKVTYKEAS